MPSVNITFTIPKKLLEQVEKRIEGKNRSQKIKKCLIKGIEIITSEPIKEGKTLATPSLMRNPK